jgi:hypothetical protein
MSISSDRIVKKFIPVFSSEAQWSSEQDTFDAAAILADTNRGEFSEAYVIEAFKIEEAP